MAHLSLDGGSAPDFCAAWPGLGNKGHNLLTSHLPMACQNCVPWLTLQYATFLPRRPLHIGILRPVTLICLQSATHFAPARFHKADMEKHRLWPRQLHSTILTSLRPVDILRALVYQPLLMLTCLTNRKAWLAFLSIPSQLMSSPSSPHVASSLLTIMTSLCSHGALLTVLAPSGYAHPMPRANCLCSAFWELPALHLMCELPFSN